MDAVFGSIDRIYRMTSTNRKIAALFYSMADRLQAKRENPYRVKAYRRAADSLSHMKDDIATVAQQGHVREIAGIGKELATKIEEFLATGTMQSYEQLNKPLPIEIAEWTTLPGLTESAVQHLHFHLGITTLDDLETLVRSHFLRTLPGVAVVEDDLLKAIHALRLQTQQFIASPTVSSAEDP